VPVLAEASVLFFGTTDLSWRRFLVPVALGNLVIALGYAALGHWVALPIAIPLALAIPAALFLVGGGSVTRGASTPRSDRAEAEPPDNFAGEEEP
jgi:hypothetical protein